MTIEGVQLRYLADILVSNVDKKVYEGDEAVRLVNYTDVYYTDRITPDLALMKATATKEQLSRFRVRAGDSIITKDSETAADIAVPAYVERADSDMVCGYHLALLRPVGGVHPRFLFWALAAAQTRGQFSVRANGMTRYGLTYDAIASVNLNVPLPDEQRRIAHFLDRQVALVETVAAARQDQHDLAIATYESWLTEEWHRLGAEYGFMPLRYAITGVSQGWSPQCEDREPQPGEWGVLRAGCVNGGRFNPRDRKALPTDVPPRREYEVRPGDFLVNRASGSLDLIGSAAVAHDVEPLTLLCDKVYRMSLTGRLTPEFLMAMWRSRPIREALRLGVSGADGMANSLPSGVIKSLTFPAVDWSLQSPWTGRQREVESAVREAAAGAARSISLLDEWKRSLISAAVSGEMDVAVASGRGIPE